MADTTAELNRIMQNEDIFLVDVHTPKQLHIKGSNLFIPYNEEGGTKAWRNASLDFE
jgi:rhodanese-related sulfurtransferase